MTEDQKYEFVVDYLDQMGLNWDEIDEATFDENLEKSYQLILKEPNINKEEFLEIMEIDEEITMEEASQLTWDLIALIVEINQLLPIDEEDKVLIVMSLRNKDEQIIKFINWCLSKQVAADSFNITAARIVSAAVRFGRGRSR